MPSIGEPKLFEIYTSPDVSSYGPELHLAWQRLDTTFYCPTYSVASQWIYFRLHCIMMFSAVIVISTTVCAFVESPSHFTIPAQHRFPTLYLLQSLPKSNITLV